MTDMIEHTGKHETPIVYTFSIRPDIKNQNSHFIFFRVGSKLKNDRT